MVSHQGYRFWHDRRGSMAIDYAILAALVAILVIIGLLALSGAGTGIWDLILTRSQHALDGG